MPAIWFALKRSLNCKSSEMADVHDPKGSRSNLSKIQTRKPRRFGCSKSISNMRDVIHGSKRSQTQKAAKVCSPRSVGSSDFLNPITHEVIFSDSKCELKITGFGANGSNKAKSTFVGTLVPGTPGPGGHYKVHCNPNRSVTPTRKILGDNGSSSKSKGSLDAESLGFESLVCQKCGENFKELDAVEAHHLTKHAVTELVEGDSSRKIVEMICLTSWLKSENKCGGIERVLKVHNTQKTIARFEDYREMVKIKASKLVKKHPRCLADGNELLRFYGTKVACSLALNGCSSSLCTLDECGICQILRHGFSTKEFNGGNCVFTASTSDRAFDSIEINQENQSLRKALIVCRVIAGRVHRPLENLQEMASESRFDSLAGKMDHYSNIVELYLLNPEALLPCFVVICKSRMQKLNYK